MKISVVTYDVKTFEVDTLLRWMDLFPFSKKVSVLLVCQNYSNAVEKKKRKKTFSHFR